MRRSGRTTAGLRSALEMTRKHDLVYFVVWNHAMREQVMHDLMMKDYFRGLGRIDRLEVVTWDWYNSPRRYPGGITVYDHYVTEQLGYKVTGHRVRDTMIFYLKIGEWYQQKVLPTDYLGHGMRGRTFNMAVVQPIADFARYPYETAPMDSSVSMKTVRFSHRGKYKDGYPVLEEA